jgi:hypothetical protein
MNQQLIKQCFFKIIILAHFAVILNINNEADALTTINIALELLEEIYLIIMMGFDLNIFKNYSKSISIANLFVKLRF